MFACTDTEHIMQIFVISVKFIYISGANFMRGSGMILISHNKSS